MVQCSITWGVIETRPEDRGRRAEFHYVTSNTILYRFEAAKQPKMLAGRSKSLMALVARACKIFTYNKR